MCLFMFRNKALEENVQVEGCEHMKEHKKGYSFPSYEVAQKMTAAEFTETVERASKERKENRT